MSTAVVQRVARMTAEGDSEGLANVIRTASIFFSASGAVAVFITAALAPFLGTIVQLGDISTKVAGVTLILLGSMIAMKFIAAVPGAVLFGVGRNDRQSQIGLAGLFVTQLAQVVVVLLGGGLVWLGIVTLAGTMFSFGLTSFLVRRMTGFTVASGRFDRQILVDLLKFGGRNTVIAISGIVSYSLDALIIGIILPVAQVAPYDIALSTANLTRNLTTYGSDLLLPTYAHFETMKDPHRQARLFSRTVMATLAISLPILVALAAFGDPILKLWLGNVPPKTYSIMIALGFVTALELPGHQCFVFLTGIGRNQLMMRMAVLGASINLIGSIIATFALGSHRTGHRIVAGRAGHRLHHPADHRVPLPRDPDRALCEGRAAPGPARRWPWPVCWPSSSAGVFPAPHTTHVFRGGVRAVISALVVVVGAWAVMVAVTLRIEPDMRHSVVARLRRRGTPDDPPADAEVVLPAPAGTRPSGQDGGVPVPSGPPPVIPSTPGRVPRHPHLVRTRGPPVVRVGPCARSSRSDTASCCAPPSASRARPASWPIGTSPSPWPTPGAWSCASTTTARATRPVG